MLVEFLIFVLTTVLVYLVYQQKRNHSFYRDNGIKFLPGWIFFGNSAKSALQRQHVINDVDDVYRAFPNERYVGYIEGMQRLIMIRDPALIKMITVKDFDHFTDHRQFLNDPLFSDSLIMMKGDKWRDMRTTMSPAFTGSKMRNMLPFIIEISQNFIEYLKETEGQDIDIANLLRRYTNDVIASTAFGLQVNSLKDPGNEFYQMGQTMMTFTNLQKFKMFVLMSIPFLRKYLTIFPVKTTSFFRDIVNRTMEHRELNNIERPDMIQILMEASKGTLKATTNPHDKSDDVGFATTTEGLVKPKGEVRKWTQDELVAQAFIFFFAAFESSATVLVMAIHELAINPLVQDKLYQEIKAYQEKHGKLAYEGLHELKYLDCILNETFRKWSPGIIMDRVCQKPYTLPPPCEGGNPYTLEVGQVVYNVINSLHMDEQYYPQPDKFIPERFSDENKHKIDPFTFMPFGSGPRNCIGSRFALLELKVLLYFVMLNFKIMKCEKTTEPIVLQKTEFNIRSEGGSWVKFMTRT